MSYTKEQAIEEILQKEQEVLRKISSTNKKFRIGKAKELLLVSSLGALIGLGVSSTSGYLASLALGHWNPSFAVSQGLGKEVFKKNCSGCHIGEAISKAEFMKQIKTVKAPPMIEISNRLKNTIQIDAKNENEEEIHRFAVISFIKEYLKYPSFDYYTCNEGAIRRFDVMPSQKYLSEDELQAVAEWIYDEFEGKEFK